MSDPKDYVDKVRESTTSYVKDILAENEKLRVLVHTLEQELDKQRKEKMRLEQQIQTIEAECKRYFEQFVEVELLNSNVANLYVASFRLHGTLDRAEVLSAIQEIVINLIGSEELAIFEVEPDAKHLTPLAQVGLESVALDGVPVTGGAIGRAIQTGEIYVANGDATPLGGSPLEKHLTACVPLLLDGRVTGVIAIFRLLSHKRRFEEVDQELFKLLARQAATALYVTALHAKTAHET